ncbi:MAG: uroporphyrinogen decarboxylase family protein [Chitinivibrionales bacterium]|nr:uroporphyrinogen decarboxylase family protein [Chitinivibrionales bacterium]
MDAQEMQALFEKKVSYTENVPVPKGEMSPRQRFLGTMNFEKVDRIIDREFGYWSDTLKRWREEGMPASVTDDVKADLFFGFDQWERYVGINTGILPVFPEEIIEKNEKYTVKYDSRHIKCQVFTNGKDTIPHYLDFPIKDRETYLPFKKRFLPELQARIPENIAEIGRQVKGRNYILSVFTGSTAGWIRDFMGFEGFSISTCTQPELIDEILEDLSDVFYYVAQEVTKHLSPDTVVWWEDIAFKTGPIVSPDFFSSKCGPVYKRAMDVYHKSGTQFAWVDCDGDNRLLVPTWLQNGVNIIFPLEVNAGIHPETLRRLYPGVRMMGGFDKVVLLKGTDEIRKELLRLKPLVDEGGFIPHIDHRVQADVPYKNFVYYLEAKRDVFGIPNKILN